MISQWNFREADPRRPYTSLTDTRLGEARAEELQSGGSWIVDPSLNSMSSEGRTVRLEPKVMGVLVCLAQHPGETVSKEQLFQAVWPNIIVTEDVLKRCIAELRRAFDDDARNPHIIETISKRGYRLLAPVSALAAATAAAPRFLPISASRSRRLIAFVVILGIRTRCPDWRETMADENRWHPRLQWHEPASAEIGLETK